VKTCRIQHIYQDSYFRVPCDDPENAWALLMQEPGESGPPAHKADDGLVTEDYRVVPEEGDYYPGRRFRGPEGVYRCTSYDSRQGFWMLNEQDPSDWRNVSERAIGRTYHWI
jgi:hypothetical protein